MTDILFSKECIAVFLFIGARLDQIISLEQRQLFQRLHALGRSHLRIAGNAVRRLYKDISRFFSKDKINKRFRHIFIGFVLNLAYGTYCPACLIVNGAHQFLSLGADQILIGNKVDSDKIFAGTGFLSRCESGRSELRYLRFQRFPIFPAFFLTIF